MPTSIAVHRFSRAKGKLLRQISLIMRLSAILLLVGTLHASAEGVAQKISLKAKKMPVQKVFKEIEKQSGFHFIYAKEQVAAMKPVDIYVTGSDLKIVLDIVFSNQPYTYTLTSNYIVLKEKPIIGEVKVAVEEADPPFEVKGKVLDDQGNPLDGASVKIKETNTGVATDKDGGFSLNMPAEGGTLVISFVGFETIERKVTKAGDISISLVKAINKTEEIVVVGYGTQRQKDVTGAVSTVNSKHFNTGPVMSPQQSIQGKLAGVNISQNSGKPGGSTTIRIRGGTSLTGINDPLYVIDGVPISTTAGVAQANIRGNSTDFFDQEPTNPLMTLNPDDIESVTVLKDASASAIYGSRAANGVIVITTKKGTTGAPKLTFGSSVGFSKAAKQLDVLSAEEYRKAASDLGITIDDKGANTNWQDEILRTAVVQDYNLALSGGSGKTNYRASLGYGDQESIMIGSDLKRATARLNVNHSALNDRLSFDMRVTYAQVMSNNAPVSNTVGSELGSSMNYEAYVFNPTYPVYDPDGNYYHVRPYRVNPVSFSTDVLDEMINDRFLGNLSTTYKILKPLSVNVNLGYTKQHINRNSYIKKSNILGEGLGGYASVQKLEDYSKLLETVVRYNNKWGKHSLDAIGGYSWQYFVNEGDRTAANGFLSDEFKWYSLQAASTINLVNTFKQSNTLISFYARANYSFNDRFLVTATLRRDGSSRFGEDNKWGTFPSGSVAWRISNEGFFNSNLFSDLKVRASYGATGNQEIGNLNSLTTLGATSQGYLVGGQRITTVLPQQYANPDLKWEQTEQFNAGVDFAMFKGRLRGSVDYYIKTTSDLLLRIPVPSPTAVSTQLANVGSVENRGFEIDLHATVIEGKKFGWQSNFNFSRNKNEVTSLSNDQYKGNNIRIAPLQGQGLTAGIYAQLIMPGQPLGTFWGRRYEGVKGGVEQILAGDTIIGDAQPDFTFGFNNTLTYNQFSLTFNFRGSIGNDVYNLTANNLAYLVNMPGRNVMQEAVSSGVGRSQPKQYSSRWIEDGSFVRLDNLTLAYDFPIKNKSLLSNARLYITGQNLLLFTNYSGLDPEVNSEVSGTGVAPLGIDYLAYPRAKTVSLGLNVSF